MTAVAMLLAASCAVLAAGRPVVARRRLTGLSGHRLPHGSPPPARAADSRPRVVAVILLGCAGAVAAGPTAGALVGLASLAGRRAAVLRRERAVRCAAAESVPEACRTISAELAAGATPARALEAAASGCPEPLSGVLRAAACAEGLGATAASVLMHPPTGCEALLAVAVCWEVCLLAGVGLGPTMERLATVFADELQATAIVDAELAGVRLSALVMACLPVFGLALGAVLGSEPLHFLLGTIVGRVVFAVAAILDAAGVLWINRLAERAVR